MNPSFKNGKLFYYSLIFTEVLTDTIDIAINIFLSRLLTHDYIEEQKDLN